MTGALPGAVVDAFTSQPFTGNPATVVLLPGETPAAGAAGADSSTETFTDQWHLAVAAELALAETAFVHPRDDGSWSLRCFTPVTEVDLSGHAAIAAAHWLWERGLAPDVDVDPAQLTFRTRMGDVGATRDGEGRVVLDLPLRPILDEAPVEGHDRLDGVLGVPFTWAGTAAGFSSEDRNGVALVAPGDLLAMTPDLAVLAALPLGGLVVTARPDLADRRFDGVDVLSRYLAPAAGLPEGRGTGTGHCTLAALWADEIGRELLRCRDVAPRGGDVHVTRAGGRALVAGHAVTTSDLALRQVAGAAALAGR
jgi:predicted PhzF superfamily epimerase YddE/YHI9